ncbi:HicB family protein [Micromonospora humidisoli]|uniref:Type II toxin-antitoxin system HicB family antitoxin n=1 Tax=Micromonospora humidisoli TaxID=2807622 RepID=A0ABS2JIP6_9ACTN|nr:MULTISPECIES: type II toxin-antitoxin system HicB family antitoxin [Micromonospora]MBM7086259.1 type II toxin-antitoxin system HicB family antitoxin [Micromonospora humidisoli]GHJ08860.1 HicB family protein [Micromonospora sp. AKA109]
MVRTFTAAVHQEDDWYVARCLELDVASQGGSVDEALVNLREAVEAYLEEVAQPTIEATPLVTSFQVGKAA